MGLLKYIAGRIGVYLVVLFIGITIIFFVPRFMPADPVEGYIGRMQNQAGQTMSAEDVEELRASLYRAVRPEGQPAHRSIWAL